MIAGLAASLAAAPALAATGRFNDETVANLARALAARPYSEGNEPLPATLAKLDYDAYRGIRFKGERAYWRGQPGGFQLQMFHRGGFFKRPVRLFEVEGGTARPIAYEHDMFRFDLVDPGPLPRDLGFAGFRIHAPLKTPDYFDELAVFLGASYFRAVSRHDVYGLSARGLSIGSGAAGEEFPFFKDFWIERPASGANVIVVHALLDSPSVAGAYRFAIRPGDVTEFDVVARLYPRVVLANAGIAPLTSMYLFGSENPRRFDDFRPEVHDSDGLLIDNGAGERLWRPLANPKALQSSAFVDKAPRGFGLMQRQRDLDVYKDLEARYEARPSLWIEPRSGFGAGDVRLIEIPSGMETDDNIVAFWSPAAPLEPGREHRFEYRMLWGRAPAPRTGLLQVDSWRSGRAWSSDRRQFVLDYNLGSPAEAEGLQPHVTTSAGRVWEVVSHPWPGSDRVRLSFELDMSGVEVAELRAGLARNGRTVSETWTYRCVA